MIRCNYNLYADVAFPYFLVGFPLIVIPFVFVLKSIAKLLNLWKVTGDDRITVDIGTINRLDGANNMKRLLKNITTNPFRNKFILVNREWLVNNLASILGGRNFSNRPGTE